MADLEAERGAEVDTDAIRSYVGRDKTTVAAGPAVAAANILALCDEVDRLRAALASVSAPADRGPGEDAIDSERRWCGSPCPLIGDGASVLCSLPHGHAGMHSDGNARWTVPDSEDPS